MIIPPMGILRESPKTNQCIIFFYTIDLSNDICTKIDWVFLEKRLW